GAIGAQFFGSNGQLNRLKQGVRRGAHFRVWRRRPVPERQEPDLLHSHILSHSVSNSRQWVSVHNHPSASLTLRRDTMATTAANPYADWLARYRRAWIEHDADCGRQL